MQPKADNSLTESLAATTGKPQRVRVLFEYMQEKGQSFYDESVTQLEHGLQAAHLAKAAGSSSDRVTAALLHDIGHFLMDEHDQQSSFLAEDWYHEDVGAQSVAPFFPPAVTEPIRLHVAAKRYLCTADPEYYQSLSRASQRSFELQGGKMSEEEVRQFESNPHHETAVLLRRWDDGAKVKGLSVGDISQFHADVEAVILEESGSVVND